jgi:GntR family transcriptional regulator
VVSTAQGRGTFVRALELTTATFDLRELQELLDDTQNAEVRLLDVRVVLADERTARKLQLEPGAPTIYLRRLLSKAGRPVFYHRTYLLCDPTRPIVEAEMDVTSLQGLFSPTDQTLLKNGHLTIESTLMNAEEADLLHVSLPAAAFYLEHLFYDYQDQPVSWGWFIFPSSFLKFSACVGLHD